MVKLRLKPRISISWRKIRTQVAWKVLTQSPLGSPSSSSSRSLISPAALLVKVTARICQGSTLYCVINQAIRCVRARVLPEPAPASNSSGPVSCLTASCCIGLSWARRSVTLVVLESTGHQGPIVCSDNITPRDDPHQFAVSFTVDHRYLFNIAVTDLAHGLIKILIGMSRDHLGRRQLLDHHQIHKVMFKNHTHKILHRDNPGQLSLGIHQGEIGVLGLLYETGKLAQRHMLRDGLYITHHDVANLQRFHDISFFARLKVDAEPREFDGFQAVLFEMPREGSANHTGQHDRHDNFIAVGDLKEEKDRRHRCVGRCRKERPHPDQGVGTRGNSSGRKQLGSDMSECATSDRTQIKAGSEEPPR